MALAAGVLVHTPTLCADANKPVKKKAMAKYIRMAGYNF